MLTIYTLIRQFGVVVGSPHSWKEVTCRSNAHWQLIVLATKLGWVYLNQTLSSTTKMALWWISSKGALHEFVGWIVAHRT